MSVVSPEELRELKENAEKPLDVRAKNKERQLLALKNLRNQV